MAEVRSRARRLVEQAGFTFVEITVTMTVLAVGVLGTVSLVDGASEATGNTKGREGATALARELVEVIRSIPYQDLRDGTIPAQLQARAALADSDAGTAYRIVRRGFAYTVAVDACAVDDAKDGLGAHGGDVEFCPESSSTGTRDRNPDDYRRVTVSLTWDGGQRVETARQAALVTNPAGGLGPSVKTLTLTSPASTTIETDVELARFELQTSATPASVEWYVDGSPQGLAVGSGTNYSFDWTLRNADGSPTFPDGTYLVQARAFDADGRSGVARALTIVLNRRSASAPSGFAGGRNGNGSHVDLEWHANGEGDVIGYRVYRVDANGARLERACPPVAAGAGAFVEGATSCVDEAAPAGSGLRYVAVALDRGSDGQPREGFETAPLDIAEGNGVPAAPGGLTLCTGGSEGCNGPDGTAAPTGTTVLTWTAPSDPDGDAIAFYRIYRDGTGYANRRDRLYPTSGSLVWIDSSTGGVQHDYRVTAVDTRFGESPKAGPVTG